MADQLGTLIQALTAPARALGTQGTQAPFSFRSRWAPADQAMIQNTFTAKNGMMGTPDKGFLDVLKGTSQATPQGIPWQQWRRSTNVEYAPGASFPSDPYVSGLNLLKKFMPEQQMDNLANSIALKKP